MRSQTDGHTAAALKKGRSIHTLLKTAGIVCLLLLYLLASILTGVLPVFSHVRRRVRIENTSYFSKIALWLFGIRVRVKHPKRFHSRDSARFIISNHVSYIDILVISALVPSVFITSVELKQTPLLGFLAGFGGSLFVERRNPAGLKRELRAITDALKQGFPVVLFPEGTTSNGARVQPFKNSLFEAAVAGGGVDILPVCLRYERIDGEMLSAFNRDRLFYYGGVPFTKHFPEFLRLKSVEVEVLPLKTIRVRPGSTRKDVAAESHAAISEAYHA